VHIISRNSAALPEDQPGRQANCRVDRTAPQFAAMAEKAKNADPADWRWCPDGIRVPLAWLERGRDPRPWTLPTDLTASPQLVAAVEAWGRAAR
jgi:hypothetical protein